MNVSIRRGVPSDAAIIADFNCRMAWETEHKRLDKEVVGRGVARVFGDRAKGFYVVAESTNDLVAHDSDLVELGPDNIGMLSHEIVGQLMVTYEWSDWRDGWIWWVQSVYVREDHRRQGVFRALHEEVLKHARASGDVVGIRLYVERDNSRALATYRQLGMIDAGYLVMEMTL